MSDDRAIVTVTGPVASEAAGHIQPHEHLFCDLRHYLDRVDHAIDEEVELRNYYRSRVERDNAWSLLLDDLDVVQQEVEVYLAAGGATVVDATPPGLGRQPESLRELAVRTGLNIVMGSGFYIEPFHPPRVAKMTVEDVAAEIVSDIRDGTESGIRSGVIGEIGLSWPPAEGEVKVLRGAGLAQIETGAGLLIHPGRHRDAPAHHLGVLKEVGAELSKVTMCHVDRTLFTEAEVLELADAGLIVEFDLFGTEAAYYPLDETIDMPNDGGRIRLIKAMVDRGLTSQVMISQDICYRTQWQQFGGEGYGHILRRVLPMMAARSFTHEQIVQITRTNPARFLAFGPEAS